MSKGNEEGQAIPPEGQDGEPAEENRLSRGKFIAAAGAAGAGFIVAGAPAAMAKGWSKGSRNKALTAGQHAPGMIGGPTGFPGAARYQYPANSEEGRGILALKALRKAGKAPEHARRAGAELRPAAVREQVPGGRDRVGRGHLRAETGIKLKFVETNPGDGVRRRTSATPRRRTAASTRHRCDRGHRRLRRARACCGRSTTTSRSTGRAGTTPSTGMPGAGSTVQLFTQYNGQHVLGRVRQRHPAVRLPRRPLQQPEGEDGVRGQVRAAARPCRRRGTIRRRSPSSSRGRRRATPLYGSVERKGPFWGMVNWQHRFVCSRRPEHVLLQARRVGERQQHGRDPRRNRASALAAVVGAGRRSRRTGSRSTSSSARATVSRVARSRT